MNQLPPNWRIERFGKIFKVKYGKSIDKSLRNDFAKVPVVGSAGVMTYTDTPLTSEPTIVIGRKGNVGSIQIFKDGCYPIDTTYYMQTSDDFDINFLSYLLTSLELVKLDSSTATPSLRREDLENVWLVIPPIDEQVKIVVILEEHLSLLNAVLADAKQAKLKASQFRRSFIHEMTTSVKRSEIMGILDICDVYQPKTISTKELISDGEFPVFGANGQIGFYNKFNHEDSEVTVTCRGATCGTVNVTPPMSWITGNAMVFRPKDNRIQKGFLEYVLRGMDWTPVITGTAQPQITRTAMKDVYINVPSPEAQREIYMKLESSLTQVTSASIMIETVVKQSTNFQRSLLQAAFTGKLSKEVENV